MPWPIYSERFLHHQAAGEWTYVVPDGRRAIVTNVDAVSTVGSSTWYSLRIGDIYLTLSLFPVANDPHQLVLRQVAYQGEEIALLIEQTGLNVSVSGYLMDDTSGATGPPGDSSWRPLEEAGQLPAPRG
uniref:Uncharacterized protein n=1 Tax=uncultured prokaryote TaxID=198431 RepID=A0A0H5Q5M7_9ZZZZ|nr:hypothetical protein [uncultured prokaryote]